MSFRQRTVLALVAAAVLITTGACAAAQSTAPAGAGASPAGGEGRTVYPLTISNCGKDYTFTQAPRRVVVMNGGSVAEVSSLLELGLGDRVIANAQSYGASEVPGRVDQIARLPTGDIKRNDLLDIPREAMLGLRPDFVISTYDGGFQAESGFASREELLRAGANSYAPATACGAGGAVTGTPTIEDSYAMLRDFGKIFDVSQRAEKVISDSQAKITELTAKVQGQPAAKVLVIFPGMGVDDLSSVAGNGIWNDILAKAGATNAFAGATTETFARLSREQAAAGQVDAVIVVSFMNANPQATATSLFAQFPQWAAARNNRFAVLSDSIYLGPSNHLAVERIARLVHPEAL